MGEHPHTELWLRGYDTDKETHNHNISRIIESCNDVDEQSDVFITTRTGAIKRYATDSQTRSTKSKSLKFYLKTLIVEKNQRSLCHPFQKPWKMITHTPCMSKVELVWKNLVVKLDYA